jgi:hypothetical protein
MSRLISVVWLAVLIAVILIVALPETRAAFEAATRAHPYGMGVLKIGLLGTMGELLGKRLALGSWRLRGVRLWQRALVWGFLGLVFAVVFPLFSFGVDGLLAQGLLPGAGHRLAAAFWKSLMMNTIFAFPMMVFHRVTDTLIDDGRLFSRWPLVAVVRGLDWETLLRVVASSCLWFWVPAHTLTFVLPSEYRVLSAALLAIALGAILGVARRRQPAAGSVGELERPQRLGAG